MRFPDPNRRTIVLFAVGAFVFLALLGALQAFNTSSVRFLSPETAGETVTLTGLIVLVFLLLMTLLVLLFRNILKLYAGQTSTLLGARLRTRMVMGAAMIGLTPAVFMFLFSFELMNRSIDRWFSPNTSQLRDDSSRVALELAQYVANNARGEAQAIAESGALDGDANVIGQLFQSHRVTLDGGFVFVYDKDSNVIASFQVPQNTSPVQLVPSIEDGDPENTLPLSAPLPQALISSTRSNEPVVKIGAGEYALGLAITTSGKTVIAGLPMPSGLSQTTARIRSGAATYWDLFQRRHRIRTVFLLMLMLITAFVVFISVWLALFLSKQITRPVEALAESMTKIAAGEYGHRVALEASAEMGDLVRAFNHMAADLDASHQLAESSSTQLSAAILALEERRRELETIVETIPSGVVTLDGAGTILQSNRAFAALIGCREDVSLCGENINSVFPAEGLDDLAGVIRRGMRMGAASSEIEMQSKGRILHLAITSARLDLAGGIHGSVLVVEDTSELLRAQRQLAWKEVAQRVAHEIKNPLTPIALSAERIGRLLDRGQLDRAHFDHDQKDHGQKDPSTTIRRCAEVILGCVGTLRTLVDQFSALAQFPASQPHLCDMNQVAEQALALFAGRLEGITVQWDLDPTLPPVLADPEAIRRALANLVDNAAEAMHGSLLRYLTVQTGVSEDASSVEVTVSDTGHGITDEIRERLFLPFYSTKHRGTGLGLSIAAKIAQEHGGSLRAESNSPKGARFILRLPLVEQPSPVEQSPLAAQPNGQPVPEADSSAPV